MLSLLCICHVKWNIAWWCLVSNKCPVSGDPCYWWDADGGGGVWIRPGCEPWLCHFFISWPWITYCYFFSLSFLKIRLVIIWGLSENVYVLGLYELWYFVTVAGHNVISVSLLWARKIIFLLRHNEETYFLSLHENHICNYII